MDSQRAENQEIDHGFVSEDGADRQKDGMQTGRGRWKGIIAGPSPHRVVRLSRNHTPGLVCRPFLDSCPSHIPQRDSLRRLSRGSDDRGPGLLRPTTPPVLTVSAVAASEGQSAPAGNPLPLPLRVRVQSDGTPKAGVMVTWQASAGTISPDSSLTDVSGEASATWILGRLPGP